MRKMPRLLAALLLCALLLPGSLAWATGDSGEAESSLASPTDPNSIIDGTVLTSKIQKILDERNIDPKKVSVGYYYSATGDSWYFNGDKWFYPASMYKVPLVMLLAEKVHNGELTQDSMVYDGTVADIEEHILTYSNNDWAHAIRKYLGGDAQWRADAKKYAQLKEEDYDSDYLDYCYFNNRYMTQVMTTLYTQNERFPNVVECLLTAEPEGYYRQTLGDQYEIAQKYGSFEDSRGVKFNHCTAIIYTPNPIVVTVMTSDVSRYEAFIAEVGQVLAEYTLQLDPQLDEHKQALEQAAREEEQRRQEEEAAAQRQREEQQRQAQEAEEQRQAQEKKDNAAQKRKELLSYAVKIAAALAVLAVLVLLVLFQLRRIRAQREEDRRYQEQQEDRRYQARRRRYAPDAHDDDAYGYGEAPYDERQDARPYIRRIDRNEEAAYGQEGYNRREYATPRDDAPEYRAPDESPYDDPYETTPRRTQRTSPRRGRNGGYTPKH